MKERILRLGMTAFFVSFQVAIVLSTFQAINFSKRLSTSDFDVSRLVTELSGPSSRKFGSLLECANYANLKSQSQVWEERCSAFKFENGNCTLARTPPFIDELVDKKRLTNGDEGYFVAMNKPLSRDVHSDLVAYVLINEEEYFNAHRNLPFPPESDSFDGINKMFDFNKESPVKTREGHLAGTPINSAGIAMSFAETQNLTETTICVWYNSGSTLPALKDALFIIRGADPVDFDRITMKVDDLGQLNYKVRFDGTPGDFTVTNTLLADTWYYITSTYNIETGEAKVYLNGSEAFSQVGPVRTGFFSPNKFKIGLMSSHDLSGYIASFEIYGRVLSTNEVLDSMEKSVTYRV